VRCRSSSRGGFWVELAAFERKKKKKKWRTSSNNLFIDIAPPRGPSIFSFMASTLRALLGRPPPPTPGFRAGLAVVSAFFAASALDTPATLPLRQLTVASLVGSSLGWVRPIWFISVGKWGG
jgi:hypothetical protein